MVHVSDRNGRVVVGACRNPRGFGSGSSAGFGNGETRRRCSQELVTRIGFRDSTAALRRIITARRCFNVARLTRLAVNTARLNILQTPAFLGRHVLGWRVLGRHVLGGHTGLPTPGGLFGFVWFPVDIHYESISLFNVFFSILQFPVKN